MTPGQERVIRGAIHSHVLGEVHEGFPFAFKPRGGQHRAAQKLVDDGLLEWVDCEDISFATGKPMSPWCVQFTEKGLAAYAEQLAEERQRWAA